jgi:hypothetical protein
MSAEQCPARTAAEGSQAYLPHAIASQLEALRLERIRQFADNIHISGSRHRSELEESVDSLLDSLSVMHQLDQIAAQVARGRQAMTDADLMLIADNEETYTQLLDEHLSKRRSRTRASDILMRATPRPIS